MSTESLIIELDAKTSKLDAKLRKTERRLDELDDSVEKTDKGFKKLGGAVSIVGGVLKDLVVTAVAAGAAVSALAIGSAKGRKELELLSKQSKTSIEDFQALTFATKQFGISAEQFADISKDISDKVGEYATAGTGAFQDYADVLGLTKDQAKDTAKEFQSLTSQQVIARVTKDLEKAGATGAQTTFVLESLGNDLSRLAPLYANNSKELNRLRGAYTKINKELEITDAQSEQLAKLSTDFDLLTGTLDNAATKISASLAPALSELFNNVINTAPQATQGIVNFINTFREAENIKSITDVTEQLKIQKETLESLTEEVERNRRGTAGGRTASENAINVVDKLNERIAEEEQRYLQLSAQLFRLNKEKEKGLLLDAETLKGGDITAGKPVTAKPDDKKGFSFGFDAADSELLANTIDEDPRVLNEIAYNDVLTELRGERLENERSFIEQVNELRLTGQETAEELLARDVEINRLALENKLISEQKFHDEQKKLSDDYLKTKQNEVKVDNDFDKQRISSTSAYLSAASGLIGAFFEDNKGLRSAMVVADTAAGISRQFADLPYPAALATSAAIAASGVAQLAAINSSSPDGGGSISASGGSASSVTQPAQQDFVPETDSLEFTDSTAGGSTTQTITFASDTGDNLVDAIAEALNKGRMEGRFS